MPPAKSDLIRILPNKDRIYPVCGISEGYCHQQFNQTIHRKNVLYASTAVNNDNAQAYDKHMQTNIRPALQSVYMQVSIGTGSKTGPQSEMV